MYLTEPKSPWKSHVSRPQWPVAGLSPFILLQFIKLTFPIASDKDVDKSYGTQLNIQAREHSLIDFFKKAYFPVYIWEKNDTQESLGNSPISHSKQVMIFEDANSCVLILNLIDVTPFKCFVMGKGVSSLLCPFYVLHFHLFWGVNLDEQALFTLILAPMTLSL